MEQIFYLPSTMLWPLAACLVLTGIHVYLGVHVIARKVIFVDLALAQIAALGTVSGVLLGYDVGKDPTAIYLYSLAFTIFGAFIFSTTRMKGEKVPHEAIIGIVYAVTFAATILVLSRSALGPQELDHIIKGELLWVQAPVVIKTAVIYGIVGLFHFIFRKKFMAISFNPAKAENEGLSVRLWDFLFYMSFGFVITSSVAIAGVFLVFSYLVIPSVGGMLISEKLSVRLITGWIGGAIISFIGVKLSWTTGLPTSPLIVVLFALTLILSGIIRYFRIAPDKKSAVGNMFAALAVVAIFAGGLFFFRKAAEDPLEHAISSLTSPIATDRQTAIMDLRAIPEKKEKWLPLVTGRLHDQDNEVRKAAIELLDSLKEVSALSEILKLLNDNSDEVKESAIKAIRDLGDSAASAELFKKSESEPDPEMRTRLLVTSLELGNPDAVLPLIAIVNGGGIFAEDAFGALKDHLPFDFKKEDTGKLLAWWNEHRTRMHWRPANNMFAEQ